MNKELVAGLSWGGGIAALAVAATLARKLGVLEPETVTRLVIGANGLMTAWYGNRIPKAFARGRQARRAQRVAGRAMVASGLAYAGLWAFAPLAVAGLAGLAVMLAGIAVTLGYCVALRPEGSAR